MSVAEKIDRQPRPRAVTPEPEHQSLWAAFAAAQAEFGAIAKSHPGARASQKYAPLDGVLDAVRPILNKHGLALTQATFVSEGTLFVRSSVVHTLTGELHSAEYPAGGFNLQHQQLGAGVTYARRYSLLSILGVFPADEDDDGEKAGPAGERNPSARPQKVLNPETGRMVDPNSAHQQRKNGTWEAFTAKLRSFSDLDELEQWWADGDTQAKIDRMPGDWPTLAAEEYEKAQERLMSAGRP